MTGVRIGLTQRVESLPDRGERRDALDQAWLPWIAEGGDFALPIPNCLPDVEGFIREFELGAFVLTGGNDLAHLPDGVNPAPERDATEAAILDYATRTGCPVLAVCRGMQMLVVHSGGGLVPVVGHVGGAHALEKQASPWPLRNGRVNSFHDWGVGPDGVGPILEVLATAPDGTVEAVAHRTLPQVGIMWHPERAEPDPMDRELLRTLIAKAR